MPVYDAILIPGGGVRAGGELPPWSKSRFELVLELETGEPIVCLSAGTPHRAPPLDEHGFPIFECVAGAQYLMSRGMPAGRLLLESASWDTIGNAYFSKTAHVDPAAWSKLLIVTSEFHMPRSREIFEWMYGSDRSRSYELHFAASHDSGLDFATLAARRRKESDALRQFRTQRESLHTPHDIHTWLFTNHDAYSPTRSFLVDRTTDEKVRESY